MQKKSMHYFFSKRSKYFAEENNFARLNDQRPEVADGAFIITRAAQRRQYYYELLPYKIGVLSFVICRNREFMAATDNTSPYELGYNDIPTCAALRLEVRQL